jgi:hypothetical protein
MTRISRTTQNAILRALPTKASPNMSASPKRGADPVNGQDKLLGAVFNRIVGKGDRLRQALPTSRSASLPAGPKPASRPARRPASPQGLNAAAPHHASPCAAAGPRPPAPGPRPQARSRATARPKALPPETGVPAPVPRASASPCGTGILQASHPSLRASRPKPLHFGRAGGIVRPVSQPSARRMTCRRTSAGACQRPSPILSAPATGWTKAAAAARTCTASASCASARLAATPASPSAVIPSGPAQRVPCVPGSG